MSGGNDMTSQLVSHTVIVGDAQITLIRDGDLTLPVAELFPGVPSTAWADRLPEAGDGQVVVPVYAVLVRVDGEEILIVAGLGAGQGGGALLPALAALGLAPDDITRVVITHTHADHVGGALTMADGTFRPTFPRARHHLPRGDWEWVHGASDPEFEMYRQVLAALPEPTLDAPDARLTPSLRSVDAAGHTPGHRALVVESGGRAFCFVADLVHDPVIQFAEPDRVTAWDARPDLTPPSRRRIAAQAVAGDWLLAAAHDASSTFGRLTPAGPERWSWQPAER
jgi:glyoxylase-like metal-dependent hydrolase (beta-lactamase superfamily II)